MSRDSMLFLKDIIDRAERVRALANEKTVSDFASDDALHEAILRHLTIIGEAVKQLPDSLCATEPNIPWRKIAKLRDLLVHVYFGINDRVIWRIVTTDLA